MCGKKRYAHWLKCMVTFIAKKNKYTLSLSLSLTSKTLDLFQQQKTSLLHGVFQEQYSDFLVANQTCLTFLKSDICLGASRKVTASAEKAIHCSSGREPGQNQLCVLSQCSFAKAHSQLCDFDITLNPQPSPVTLILFEEDLRMK